MATKTKEKAKAKPKEKEPKKTNGYYINGKYHE